MTTRNTEEPTAAAQASWPAVSHETLLWRVDPDYLALIPRSRRRRIAATYEAAVPAHIGGLSPSLPADLSERLGELLADLVRFDEQQNARGFDLPALLLRSESAASSQIERLTSSVRNVALAELTEKAPRNARLIAGNVGAMRDALATDGTIDRARIRSIHATLMAASDRGNGGRERDQQVWVGGSGYSPHGAIYVAPAASRVPELLDDLVAFAGSPHVNPIAKAAILHAQFETIHPFIDGNGRTGRALLHLVLRQENILEHAALPVSAGLLHEIDAYMGSIVEYQQGNPEAVVRQVASALETAMSIGNAVAGQIDAVLSGWRAAMTERKGSSMHVLPTVLVAQPVVTASYLADKLGITPRAAGSLVNRAREYGILEPIGSGTRSTFYQASDVIDILETASDLSSIRRMLAPH